MVSDARVCSLAWMHRHSRFQFKAPNARKDDISAFMSFGGIWRSNSSGPAIRLHPLTAPHTEHQSVLTAPVTAPTTTPALLQDSETDRGSSRYQLHANRSSLGIATLWKPAKLRAVFPSEVVLGVNSPSHMFHRDSEGLHIEDDEGIVRFKGR